MTEKKRPYRLRERAKTQKETRRKIVEATMRLHEEVGPRATTISAIADRAGVQRLTVYRHFEDETALFQACTSHWLELNAPPDPAGWKEMDDPIIRFRTAISAFYEYFARTRRMWNVSYRDVDQVPALHKPMAEFEAFLNSVAHDLAAAFNDRKVESALMATVRHILHYATWAELEAQGLRPSAKLGLVTSWMHGARCKDKAKGAVSSKTSLGD